MSEPVDPDLVAKATFQALGELIAKCDPSMQPSAEMLASFLGLYREIRGAPAGLPLILQQMLESMQKHEKALGVLAQKALQQPEWTRGR